MQIGLSNGWVYASKSHSRRQIRRWARETGFTEEPTPDWVTPFWREAGLTEGARETGFTEEPTPDWVTRFWMLIVKIPIRKVRNWFFRLRYRLTLSHYERAFAKPRVVDPLKRDRDFWKFATPEDTGLTLDVIRETQGRIEAL